MLRGMVLAESGWSSPDWRLWSDVEQVRARLAAGADPNRAGRFVGKPLYMAVEHGSADVVAELAARVDDVDLMSSGRTALWRAVFANRPENARALAAAGADPWRPMMAGWSPGKLSLAGATPDLFGSVGSLSAEEAATVAEGHRLTAALADLETDGLGLACVAGIDSAEAIRRLGADVVEDAEALAEEAWADSLAPAAELSMWATDVPGGCIVAQPWSYAPSMPSVTIRLSAGTTCYAMFANPKSGNQGSISRNGELLGSDLRAGGGSDEDDPAEEILAAYLYQHNAVAYCCAYAGLSPTDARAITGPPDTGLRLPAGDYWH